MDYRKAASEVIRLVGGKENIVSAAHCATRLRMVIADNSKVSKEALEEVEGAKGVFEASGQLQIIFGTGVVNKVYDEFIAIAGISAATKEEVKKDAASKGNPFQRFIKTLGDIFVPIIPAIVASGFLMGIMESLNFLINNGYISMSNESSLFVLANMFSNTAYVFLPVLIGFSAAKVFGGNSFLGAVIGMIMVHPNLQNAWTMTGGVEQYLDVFGLWKVPLVGYQGHVISVIIAVFVMATIEKWLHKRVPAMFDLFVTPLVSVFVTGFLTMTVIGPVFNFVESSIINGIQALITIPFGIGSFVMGTLYAPTVVTGIHHMYTIIDLGQIKEFGCTYWLPLASAANIAQGAAALAVALKTRDQKLKAMALPSSLSAFMGITEPAIFGVNLRFGKPFVLGLVAGACGGWLASIFNLAGTGFGITIIPGTLLYLNGQVLKYIIMVLATTALAFVLTYMFGYEDDTKDVKAAKEAKEVAEEVTALAQAGVSEETVVSPLSGQAVELSAVNDPVFSSGAMGKGIAIKPNGDTVYSPVDGTVQLAFETGHAYGLKSDNGAEILIHIGIDTVSMAGKGFNQKVAANQKVKKGDVLGTFDRAAIAEAGLDDTTMIIVTNTADYQEVTPVAQGELAEGAALLELK